jgi:hypothetical protein
MKPSNPIITRQAEPSSLIPNLDTGLYNLAAYISEYLQSLRQLEKKSSAAR